MIHRTDIRDLHRRMSFQHRWPPPSNSWAKDRVAMVDGGESFTPGVPYWNANRISSIGAPQ